MNNLSKRNALPSKSISFQLSRANRVHSGFAQLAFPACPTASFQPVLRPCLSLFFSVWRVSGECRLRSIRHSISPAAPYRRFSSCVHATQSESTSNEVTVAPRQKADRLNNPLPLPASSGRDFSLLSMMSVLRPPLREIKSGRWIG